MDYSLWVWLLVGMLSLNPMSVCAAERCVDRAASHLKKCLPFSCTESDPHSGRQPVDLEIQGRRNGLCQASGRITGQGGLDCSLSMESVRYLTSPATLEALQSPDLHVAVRLPESQEEALAALQGHPLLSADVKGRPIDTRFISKDCALTLK